MKRPLTAAVLGALLLVLFAGLFRLAVTPGSEEVPGIVAAPAESAEPSAAAPAVPAVSIDSAQANLPAQPAAPASAAADLPALPERGGRVLYTGRLIDTASRPTDDPAVFRRTRLLETDFHAPILRVEERVRLSAEGDGLEILEQLGMVGDHVLVRLHPQTDFSAWTRFLAEYGMAPHSSLQLPGVHRITVPANSVHDLPEALAILRGAAHMVVYAEPDHVVHSTQNDPNDPAWVNDLLWGLRNTGQLDGTPGMDIGATEGWLIRNEAPDVIVGVIDTGVLYTHEDLAANMWINPGETADGTDSDGNGYIDDIHGINAITNSGSPMDDNRHGTHCAGTIGAVGNNATGLTGVAWNVQLMALKFLSAQGSGITSHAADCIVYGVNHGATILSNSWGGGGFNQALVDAIEYAAMADVIFVAAAGNDRSNLDPAPQYPASYPVDNIVSVASYDRTGARSFFSNYGQASVHLAAPGSNIYSTTISRDNPTATNLYEELSGTSMAAPHVSGVMALMRAQFPAEGYLQIINRAMATANRAIMQGQVIAGGIDLPGALSGEPTGPFNDDFANARFLGRRSFVTFANNSLATAEPAEPAHGGHLASHSVWFRWQAPFANEVDVFTSQSAFANVIAVYQGTSLDNLTLVASADTAPPDAPAGADAFLTFTSVRDQFYFIAVDSTDGTTGAFRLTIKNAPPNDDFARAQALTGTGGTFRTDNTGATKEPGEPRHGGLWGGSSLWYKFTPPFDGRLRVGIGDGSPTRIGIGIYSGDDVSNLTELGGVLAQQNTSNQNAFAIVQGGQTYHIAVDTPDGQERWFFVNWGFESNQIAFTEETITVAENIAGGEIIIPVNRFSGFASFGAASVTFTTSNAADGAQPGIDYTPVTGTLSWGANEQGDRTLSVPIIDNDLIQDTRAFYITLSAPTGGSYLVPGRHRLRVLITDDDSPLADLPTFDTAILFPEINPTPLDLDPAAWIAVERIGAVDRAESVGVVATDGSAVAGVSYLAPAATLEFVPGQRRAWIEVLLPTASAGQTFSLTLVDPSHAGTLIPAAQATATVNIAAGQAPPWFAGRRLLTHDSAGEPLAGNRSILHLDVSDDGRFVVFSTDAALVPEDTNGETDVYLRDMATGTITLVSHSIYGGAGDGESTQPTISGDGRWILYESAAPDILADDPNGPIRDIILFDRITGAKEAVNRNSEGELAQIQYINLGHPVYVDSYDAAISKDGQHVVFVSTANNLDLVYIDPWWDDSVFIRNLTTGHTETASLTNDDRQYRQRSYLPSVSADGRRVAFISNAVLSPEDTNGDRPDVYVRDLTDRTTRLVTKLPSGQAHTSWAPIRRTVISGDGNHVFFSTSIPGLVTDDTDTHVNLFRRDLTAQTTLRVDTAVDGTPAAANLFDGQSFAVSHDGNVVAFISLAFNILPGDNNSTTDIFVRNLTNGLLTSPVLTAEGGFMGGTDFAVALTPDGASVLFSSGKSQLVSPPVDWQPDLFGGPSGMEETDSLFRFSQATIAYLRTTAPTQILPVTVLRTGLLSHAATVLYQTEDGSALAGIDYIATSGELSFAPGQLSATIEIPILNPPGPDPLKTFTIHLAPGSGPQRLAPPASALIELSDVEGTLGSLFRVSERNGVPGSGNSRNPSLDRSGERTAFNSNAANLSPIDTSTRTKAFLHDYPGNSLTLRARTPGGEPAGAIVRLPVLSPDGQWMAFLSSAQNLTADTHSGSRLQVYLENLHTGEIVLVSKNPYTGTPGDAASSPSAFDGFAVDISRPGLAVSEDAAFVAFQSNAANLAGGATGGLTNIFLWERATGQITRISQAPDGSAGAGGASIHPAITPDGRYIAFISAKHNLVPGDTNGESDVFRYDRLTGEIIRINLSSTGAQAVGGRSWVCALSDDGDRIVFDSTATNLVPNDTNGVADIFLRTVSTGTTTRLSVNTAGEQSTAFNNGFRMAGHSLSPAISGDGRHVVFHSDAYGLVPGIEHLSFQFGDTTWVLASQNLFVRDLVDGITRNLIPVTPGVYGRHPVISGNGTVIAFASDSEEILPGGSGTIEDVFVVPNPLYTEPPFQPAEHRWRAALILTEIDGQRLPGLLLPAPPAGSGTWRLQSSPDLDPANWQPVPPQETQTLPMGTGEGLDWILLRHNLPLSPGTSRFLRAEWLP